MPWDELTFSYGSTLTASDMNALHENFSSVFAGDSGSPVAKFDAFNFNRNDLTTGLNSGDSVVLSEGLYSYQGFGGNAFDTNISRLQVNDGSSWHNVNDFWGVNSASYLHFATGLFMTYSNNMRVYAEGDGATSINSPIIYRYD